MVGGRRRSPFFEVLFKELVRYILPMFSMGAHTLTDGRFERLKFKHLTERKKNSLTFRLGKMIRQMSTIVICGSAALSAGNWGGGRHIWSFVCCMPRFSSFECKAKKNCSKEGSYVRDPYLM